MHKALERSRPTVPQIDRHCVSMVHDGERRYWTARFIAAPEMIAAALAAVGSSPKKVEQWLFLETRMAPKRSNVRRAQRASQE